MIRNRKGALLMLMVVVFWTVIPASACLLPAHNAGLPPCCKAMAQECGSPQIGTGNSCCSIQSKAPAVAPAPLRLIQQPQKFVLEAHQILAPDALNAAAATGYANSMLAPPSQFPPGSAVALRI